MTPTSYLELLSTFLKLLGAKRTEVSEAKKRLVGGLDKLTNTAAQVRLATAGRCVLHTCYVYTSERWMLSRRIAVWPQYYESIVTCYLLQGSATQRCYAA